MSDESRPTLFETAQGASDRKNRRNFKDSTYFPFLFFLEGNPDIPQMGFLSEFRVLGENIEFIAAWCIPTL